MRARAGILSSRIHAPKPEGPARLRQSIAHIDYVVTCPPGVRVREPGAIQDVFAGQAGGVDIIHVNLVAGDMPDLCTWPSLASHGTTWSIRLQGPARCLCLGEPSDGRPAGLVACWQGDTSQATVYCGPEYLKAGPHGSEMSNTAGYPVDQILLMYYLAPRRGLVVHAAGLVVEGRALIFPGISGAGKSTLARQFLARGWPGLLSDDRVIVRELEGCHTAFGTPWPGDAGVAVNAGAPLAAVLFPVRGEETHFRALSPQAALDRLLPATSVLWHEPELLSGQLETCERLLKAIPAFELAWSPRQGVVDDLVEFTAQLR